MFFYSVGMKVHQIASSVMARLFYGYDVNED